MNLTSKQKEMFANLYKRYTGKKKKFQGEDQRNIREVCAKVRTLATESGRITELSINLLVLKKRNGIANVGQGTIPRSISTASFFPIVATMLDRASTTNVISHEQYDQWKDALADVVGFKAELVFNRLAFACFPTQFCSVIKPDRLLGVCKVLQGKVGGDFAKENLDAMDWFDLCHLVVPIVRLAFLESDYADQSTFLAAIGDDLK